MIPANFPQANTILARQQPEYEPMAVYSSNDAQGTVTSCMRLSPIELEEIQRTRTLWIQQLTFGKSFQPIALSCSQPPDLPGDPLDILGLPPHQLRVINEKAALDDRIKKLGKFIAENNMFRRLSLTEQSLLSKQLGIMEQYAVVLSERISTFSPIGRQAAELYRIEDTIDEAAQMPGGSRGPIMQSVRAYLSAIAPPPPRHAEPPLTHPDGRIDTEEEAEARLEHQLFRKWRELIERAKRL